MDKLQVCFSWFPEYRKGLRLSRTPLREGVEKVLFRQRAKRPKGS